MVRILRRARKTLVLLCLTVAGTMSAGEAKADPDSRDRAELLRTIRELTQRVRELEAQVRALSASEGRVAAATAAADAGCSSPFFMGADGVRRVRLECLNQTASTESCENPFVLDATGIKRVKRACLTSMAAPSKPQ
jgi:hypothetical protein